MTLSEAAAQSARNWWQGNRTTQAPDLVAAQQAASEGLRHFLHRTVNRPPTPEEAFDWTLRFGFTLGTEWLDTSVRAALATTSLVQGE